LPASRETRQASAMRTVVPAVCPGITAIFQAEKGNANHRAGARPLEVRATARAGRRSPRRGSGRTP
jgi:hypothetical protein